MTTDERNWNNDRQTNVKNLYTFWFHLFGNCFIKIAKNVFEVCSSNHGVMPMCDIAAKSKPRLIIFFLYKYNYMYFNHCPVFLLFDRQRRLIKLSISIYCAFLLAWTPYSVVSIIRIAGYGHVLNFWTQAMPAIFAKTSTVYNPIIYVGMSANFRHALKKVGILFKISMNNIAEQITYIYL